MPRPIDANDEDWEFLDTVIAFSGTIRKHIEEIKDVSDQPDVLRLILYIEGIALVINKLAVDYRPRLRQLKQLAHAGSNPAGLAPPNRPADHRQPPAGTHQNDCNYE